MTDFWEAASLSDGLPSRQQPPHRFGLFRIAQRQRHDGLNGSGEAVIGCRHGSVGPVIQSRENQAANDLDPLIGQRRPDFNQPLQNLIPCTNRAGYRARWNRSIFVTCCCASLFGRCVRILSGCFSAVAKSARNAWKWFQRRAIGESFVQARRTSKVRRRAVGPAGESSRQKSRLWPSVHRRGCRNTICCRRGSA